MPQGTISKFLGDRGFGFIRPADGSREIWFHIRVVEGAGEEDLAPRTVVEYETEVARDGRIRAKWVRLAQSARARVPAGGQPTAGARQAGAQTAGTGPYRFLNPYNFVRAIEVRKRGAAPSLGQVEPPPHDRYVGWTGRITARLTATTPLFVSDSEGIEEEKVAGKVHKHYRFFRDPDDQIAIPGTSLRGAIRSVFEAVTNSCFAHFADDKRLSYHLPPGDALRLVPARVRKVEDKDGKTHWELDLLPGTTAVSPDYRPSGPQYAAWVHAYTPLWASQTIPKAPDTPYAARKKLSLAQWKHKDECWALIKRVQHPLRRFEFWDVVQLEKDRNALPAQPPQGQQVVRGYLCINNQNIENKHDERFFFRSPDNKMARQPLELPDDVRQRYNELIQDYRERHRDAVGKREHPAKTEGKEPAFSRFILAPKSEAALSDGDLVYALLRGTSQAPEIEDLAPVSVPRMGYRNAIGDLLDRHAKGKCHHYEQLCPACRVFGWVGEEDETDKAGGGAMRPLAYAGRVRFSHARRVEGPPPFDVTLAILSSPKPTTTRFYLTPIQGRPQDVEGRDDASVDYDAGTQKLRGRKVYRHHGVRLSPAEYSSVGGKKSDQNRTAHGVQAEGTIFEFTVEFENMNDMELGALLWSLEMEGWHHRLGFAKPLGFGSTTIQVTALQIMDPALRYTARPSGFTDAMARKAEWVQTFKGGMAERYGQPFEQLANVRDLRALLADSPPLPVHYPRPAREPLPDGKNFEWFVGNKRSGRDAGPRILLYLASDDTEGLPLLDRFGLESNR